ncbi:MAG: amidohydrolase family protein [Saprospiraceae bacterium]|nr:amidohydrolase family protein [Saprospiraceae bacterium]
MVRKFNSKTIYTSIGKPLIDSVIITDESGKILAIDKLSDHDTASVQKVSGFICPGFINAHCHLELSHMKGKVDSGTGLLPFLNKVVGFRDANQDIIQQGIKDSDIDMYNNGIVAVGDISNKIDTAYTKSHSKIDYYTFVEMFDFLQPTMTEATIAQYQSVMDVQSISGNDKKSYVPHAPYTVSPNLLNFINNHNIKGQTISIHNQETPSEDELFLYGTGEFRDFYTNFGFSLDHFKPINKSSIYYSMEHILPVFKTIFVHNTLTSQADIHAAKMWNNDVYWVTCPNANLYIENRLPNYSFFLNENAMVAIGTDSLSSNWQLSIWEEIKTIYKYASYVPLETMITWATLNGAKALGYDDRLGSIEIGKTPGLVQVDGEEIMKSNPKRLI